MSLLCPSCQVDLAMTNRQGVEIDYCPAAYGSIAVSSTKSSRCRHAKSGAAP